MKKEETTRIPRNKRVEFAPKMLLTQRDKAIILAVYENRYLKRHQIQRLLSMGTTASNRRLMRLYQHGYLERLFIPATFGAPQAIYGLDRKGSDLVAGVLAIERQAINWKKRNSKVEFLFLDHTLAIAEFRVSLELAARERNEVEILFWKGQGKSLNDRVRDPERKQKYLSVTPDAFFGILSPKGKSYFFLEVDLGTETNQRFEKKIIAYRQYWKTGKYTERYGFKSFRVLTVTTSDRRLRNLLKTTYAVGGRNMFLFAVSDDVTTKDIFKDIWRSPGADSHCQIL